MQWHVYKIPPIDLGWEHLESVKMAAGRVGKDEGESRASGIGPVLALNNFLDLWVSAQDAASEAGWLGEERQLPVVFWIPGDGEFLPGFVIKQDVTGRTFVVSPTPLAHLER